MNNQDVAVSGLLIAMLIASAFPATAKGSMYLGLFLLFIVYLSAWQTKELQTFVQALGKDLFPNAA